MPLSIAELQSQLDALKTAYRAGATSIAYEGKTITYRSVSEMQAAIASLEAELGLSIGKPIRVVTDKGW
jgi:ABC-type Fe3+ transport system substrate-binding protein